MEEEEEEEDEEGEEEEHLRMEAVQSFFSPSSSLTFSFSVWFSILSVEFSAATAVRCSSSEVTYSFFFFLG